MNHLPTQDMFECGVGAHKRGSHLVDQACVGAGEVFVDTVEDFQLDEDFLNAVNATQGIRQVEAGMGDDISVAYIGLGVADVDT